MLYIKKYSGFIISIVIGLLLYEEANYAYTYRAATAYSDHMIYRLILSMGSGSSGWNGILFPILAALPMGISEAAPAKNVKKQVCCCNINTKRNTWRLGGAYSVCCILSAFIFSVWN